MNKLSDIYSMSNAEIIMTFGKRLKDYRISMRLTQQELADRCGVSLVTLRKFENGQATNITMSNFLAMLREVRELDAVKDILPEIPISPYDLAKIEKKKPKRVYHGK